MLLRPRLCSTVATWLCVSQHGVRPKVGADLGLRTSNTCIYFRFRMNESAICFFVGIKSVSYTIIRAFLVAGSMTEHTLGRIIHHLGIPVVCIGPMMELFKQAPALEQAGASGHRQAMIEYLFQNCWRTLNGHNKDHSRRWVIRQAP